VVRKLILLQALFGFLLSIPSQIWVSDVTLVTFFGDKQCDASHLSHFWEECDALAQENFCLNLWRFLSHPSRKNSPLDPAGTKKIETGRNVTIRLGLRHSSGLRFFTYFGSVKREGHLGWDRPLTQISFSLHTSEISDNSETGRDKHVSVPAESSHFFPFKKVLYRRGQNVPFFGKDVTKNVASWKIIFVCESVTFFPEMWQMWQMWRVTFFVTEKSDKCDVTHSNLRREAGKKSG